MHKTVMLTSGYIWVDSIEADFFFFFEFICSTSLQLISIYFTLQMGAAIGNFAEQNWLGMCFFVALHYLTSLLISFVSPTNLAEIQS